MISFLKTQKERNTILQEISNKLDTLNVPKKEELIIFTCKIGILERLVTLQISGGFH